MAINVANVQDHQTLTIESVHPKLRSIKSHPYLNTYSTPPLPKPLHFHQLSDQTGQSLHKHQLSTISLPVKNSNNPFEQQSNNQTLNQPIYSQIDKQTYQPPPPITSQSTYQNSIDKQPIYLNGNIEQYETVFNYSDLERRKDCDQQIYINHPINRSTVDCALTNPLDCVRPTKSFCNGNEQITAQPFSQPHKPNRAPDNHEYLNGQLNNANGHHLSNQLNYHQNNKTSLFNQIEHHKTHSNHFTDNHSSMTQATYHGLPMKFVKALKKLFDVFDTTKCGLIRIADIETRIRDEEFDEELDRPQDLIDSLRKVTSPNGLINFSNFCAAINICLLKNQLAKSKQSDSHKAPLKAKSDRNDSYLKAHNIDKSLDRSGFPINGHQSNGHQSNGHQSNGHQSNGTHLNGLNGHRNYHHSKYTQQSSLNSNSPLENSSFTSTSSSNSSSRLHKDFNKLTRKSNPNSQTLRLKYRPSSVPVEFHDDETDYYKHNIQPDLNKKLVNENKAKSMGNLKEQIYANKLRLCSSESRIQQNAVISPQAIMEKLFEWRNNLLERKLRSMNGNLNGNQFGPLNSQPAEPNPQLNHLYSIVNKKTNPRKRDEARRHTVTSLHSLNTAKKLLNMQKEKELLSQGLIVIDRAKQFYLRQIEIVQNQIDYLNQYTQSGNSNFFVNQLNNDYNIKYHLDKLNTLEQINRSLVLLMDNQFSQTNRINNLQTEIETQKQNLTIFKLKEQVQMLSDELIRKSNVITNLENSNPFLKLRP